MEQKWHLLQFPTLALKGSRVYIQLFQFCAFKIHPHALI